MLNNLTNFFNLIRSKRIKQALEPEDLIAVGTQVSNRAGEYKPTAIRYSELLTQLDSEIGDPPSVLAGNVIYVDSTNGDDTTGVVNEFTEPFLTLAQALTFSDTLSKSETERVLIYVRRGTYHDEGQMTFRDNVDIYCEQGVVFTGSFQLRTQFEVNANFTGYAKFDVNYISSWGTGAHFDIRHPSFINIELDSIKSVGPFLFSGINGLDNLITFKANYTYPQGLNAGWGLSIRGDSNVNLNIKKYETFYRCIDLRSITGLVNINVNECYLLQGDPYLYGVAFKQIVIFENSGVVRGKVYITGNYINKVTSNPSSIATGGFRFWNSPNVDVYFKGSINAGETFPMIDMSNGSSKLTIEGNFVGKRQIITLAGSTRLHAKNSEISRLDDHSSIPITCGSSAQLYLSNTNIYSERLSNLITLNSSSRLYANNTLVESIDTSQQLLIVNSTAQFGITNSVVNMTYNSLLTPEYLINFTVEPDLKIAKF